MDTPWRDRGSTYADLKRVVDAEFEKPYCPSADMVISYNGSRYVVFLTPMADKGIGSLSSHNLKLNNHHIFVDDRLSEEGRKKVTLREILYLDFLSYGINAGLARAGVNLIVDLVEIQDKAIN